MARARRMTDAGVARLAAHAKRYTKPDPELRGHYIRVQPSGAKSYVAVARNPDGKQIWATIGGADIYGIDEAREKAREAIKRITAGKAPFPRPDLPATFGDVTETYLRRHVHKNE